MNPENKEIARDDKGHYLPGVSGNPGGRPKNTIKDYLRRKFNEMTDEEKQKWLDDNKVPATEQWKMAEGSPAQETDITSAGEALNPVLVRFLDDPTDNTNTEGV